MPFAFVNVGGTTHEPTAICDRNNSRTVLHIVNMWYGTNFVNVELLVGDQKGFGDQAGYLSFHIPPGGHLTLYAKDGWDVTKPWYAAWDDSGTRWALIAEQFLPLTVMRKLEAKGIDSTIGLFALGGLLLL